MNVPLFFLAATSLGSIAGVSGNHYFQVRQIVQEYQNKEVINASFNEFEAGFEGAGAERGKSLHGVELIDLPHNTDLKLRQEESSSSEVSTEEPVVASSQEAVETDKKAWEDQKRTVREDALIEILQAVRADQKQLKRQLAETNSELEKANFRLDTHSDSFKPLRSESERAHSLESNELEKIDGFQLLPPK